MDTALKLLVLDIIKSFHSFQGIIAGNRYGIVRGANIIDVRVADEKGQAFTHHIIAGLDYILGQLIFFFISHVSFRSFSIFPFSERIFILCCYYESIRTTIESIEIRHV
jgi:hypothetical protein